MSTTFKGLYEERAEMMNRMEKKMKKFRPYPKTIILPESLWSAEIHNIDLYECFATQGWTPRIVQRMYSHCACAVLSENLGDVYDKMSEFADHNMKETLCRGYKSPRLPDSDDFLLLSDGRFKFAKSPRANRNR